jgi:diguanylate cyclase (GGDEF)-like protein
MVSPVSCLHGDEIAEINLGLTLARTESLGKDREARTVRSSELHCPEQSAENKEGSRMSEAPTRSMRRRGPKLAVRVREAALWKTPRSAVALILSIETLCVTWLFVANIVAPPTVSGLARFVLLFFVALVYAEGANKIELLRRYVAEVTFTSVASLWCMAAAIILPVGLAGAFAALLHSHSLVRIIRSKSGRPFQAFYVASTDIMATMAAGSVLAYFGVGNGHISGSLGAIAVVLAMFTYPLIQQTLVTSVIYLVSRASRRVRLREVMLSRDDQIMEIATLALAVLLGIALVYAPLLSPMVLILVVVLRRSALVQELQVQATRDAKTGLLNAGAWRQEAERQIVRAERLNQPISVVMLDLDHFKVLNDTYGHQAGDAALQAVAGCLTDALRGYDAVGRFGGEEFIALLNDADETVSRTVAERLCARIRTLDLSHGGRVTASVGVGVGAVGSHGIDELIAVADRALYVAKGAGRDQAYVARAGQLPPLPTKNVRPRHLESA